MQVSTLLLFVAATVIALAGCASWMGPTRPPTPAPLAGHGMATVQVTATYRERILLPPGHVLTVRVEDVSLADAPSRVMAEHKETLDGRAPPYRATLGFPSSQVDPRHSYAVRAEIRDPSGALRVVTDTRYPVLTHGAGAGADVVLKAVGN